MTPTEAPLPILGTWTLMKAESSRPDLPHPTEWVKALLRFPGQTLLCIWRSGRQTSSPFN
jgi:hypothetical protein